MRDSRILPQNPGIFGVIHLNIREEEKDRASLV